MGCRAITFIGPRKNWYKNKHVVSSQNKSIHKQGCKNQLYIYIFFFNNDFFIRVTINLLYHVFFKRSNLFLCLVNGISFTLRSLLYNIWTLFGNLSTGMEDNHTLKFSFGNVPGSMEKCWTNISKYHCSPIQGTRFKILLKLGDRFIP